LHPRGIDYFTGDQLKRLEFIQPPRENHGIQVEGNAGDLARLYAEGTDRGKVLDIDRN
jgi:hypothetical protein